MNRYRRLWLRALLGRVAAEWQRLGGPAAVLARVRAIGTSEGWRGVGGRLRSLVGAGRPARVTARAATAAATEFQPGVMLVGHPFGALGVGENLRAVAAALAEAGIPFHIRDVHGSAIRDETALADFAQRGRMADATVRHKANLFFVNADEMDLALIRLGPRFFSGSYNIGCWMWELAEFPVPWRRAFDCVQEVWAQSRFVEAAIGRKAPVPVTWVPQAVVSASADPALARSLGIPADRYSFLCFFDLQSHVARKNPLGAVEAFRRAFPEPDAAVRLVIKVSGVSRRQREFREFINALGPTGPRVMLIDRVLDDVEMKGLIGGCNAFVSLHRSEGFGRGLAEAMSFGKPTIATAYSGNLDFCRPDNSCLVDFKLRPLREGEYPFWQGQSWAEPDLDQAAGWMRRLYQDRVFGQRLGQAAQRDIRQSHGAAAVAAKMAGRLRELGCL